MADLTATLTCPMCGQSVVEIMPTDRCVYFYECPSCRTTVKPKAGDCCVFCSYGDKHCPFVGNESPRLPPVDTPHSR